MTADKGTPGRTDPLLHPYTNESKLAATGLMTITEGRGIYVRDDKGRTLIEGLAGLWCTALGFGNERLADAASRAMRRLSFYHGFGGKSHPAMEELATRLQAIAPASPDGPMAKVFFANSGSEANDTAIKLVWYANNALGRPRKKKIIGRRRGYHGVTIASASLTGIPNNHRAFDLPLPGFLHTDCPHHYREAQPGESEEAFATRLAQSLDDLIQREGPDTVAAFFAEPVMGAGGVIVPPQTYFEKIQAVLRRHDVLLIADEVICGFGRTGRRFGCETFGIVPDMVTVAKALSSAYLPISALLISPRLADAILAQSAEIGVLAHGFTYSGHPVAAAVALEALRIYDEIDIVSHVQKVAPRLQDGLRNFANNPLVGEVRGVGLIAGLELVQDRASKAPFPAAAGIGAYLQARAQDHGLITRAIGGDVVALAPPLVITEAEIDLVLDRLGRALDDTTAWARTQRLI